MRVKILIVSVRERVCVCEVIVGISGKDKL